MSTCPHVFSFSTIPPPYPHSNGPPSANGYFRDFRDRAELVFESSLIWNNFKSMMSAILDRSARRPAWRGAWAVVVLMLGQVAHATTWAAVYPYTQRTEGGAITCRSVPYGVHDGPAGLGETFVYNKGQLLYSIDKYFSTPFHTFGNGRYVVSIDFHVSYPNQVTHILDESGTVIREEENEPDAKVIHIYDQGVLLKTIAFSDLRVDRSKVRTNTNGGWLAWDYVAPELDGTTLQTRMAKHPDFVEGDRLCLIAADGQLIEIRIPTGEVVARSVAEVPLAQRADWNPPSIKRRYERVKYPEKFFLPSLEDGRTLEKATADMLGMLVAERDEQRADLEVYLHTLMINRQGRCEVVYATVTPLGGKKPDGVLQGQYVTWIQQQAFETRTIPRGFSKFKYSGFLRLDRHP